MFHPIKSYKIYSLLDDGHLVNYMDRKDKIFMKQDIRTLNQLQIFNGIDYFFSQ